MTGRTWVVPVFLPHAGCPHRCAFCDQHAITGQPAGNLTAEALHREVAAFVKLGRSRAAAQIAFYGGNFLGLGEEYCLRLLSAATACIRAGTAHTIRFSTRPDTVNPDSLAMLAPYPVHTIELGAQSLNDPVLARCRRGHTAAATAQALRQLKARGYEVGLQLMVGLPGDDEARLEETGRRAVALGPDFVRIYPTVVLAGSELARWLHEGRYRPLSLDSAVAQVLGLYRLFRRHGIAVVRMGLQASADLQPGAAIEAGPYHPAFGHLVLSAGYLEAARTTLRQRQPAFPAGAVTIQVHPRRISVMRGLANANIKALKREFGLRQVAVLPDARLTEDQISIPAGEPATAVWAGPFTDPS